MSATADFETAYVQHRSVLLRFARRRLRTPEDAEDVVQDSFLRIFSSRSFGPVRSPLAFIMRSVANAVVDHHRASSLRLRHYAAFDEAKDTRCDTPDAERLLIAQESFDRLVLVIEAMPARRREVFVLHRFDGHSHSDIALRLGVSRNMVEKHMIQAMLDLRDGLVQ